ncbi:MAG: carboxymuconolactone decarboxylase family protein [Candidatus Bipolaricaulota bacterium]|nr:MAG: carboxymuconolactone decarboxylase family protein [Candidatus Bipolaricaulota bacterium]
MDRVSRFRARREALNEALLSDAPLPIKRFFALDQDVYSDGALSAQVKELLGLVASTVLRCDDCITYHLVEASAAGATHDEIVEALAVALVVGGSITIPHLREAFAVLDEL